MDEHRSTSVRCVEKKADRNVRYCKMCEKKFKCKLCDETFDDRKPLETTAYHQIKKDLTTFKRNKATMIVDLGCPNSVIGACDVDIFKKSLSHFQQENLELLDVDENFKFGPSGPYKCYRKLRIPLGTEEEHLWFTVAIVDAEIPMLLGNNLLKPLEADIKLFSMGGGVLFMKEEQIELVETRGGHYTIRVSDLGKLCRLPEYFKCELCDEEFNSRTSLKTRMELLTKV